jgi:dipeptidyl-peptidase 4
MKHTFLLLLLLATTITFAQKKQLSIEDTNNPAFRAKPIPNLNWCGASEIYAFYDAENKALVQKTIKGDKKTVLKLDDFNNQLFFNNLETGATFPVLTWEDENAFTFVGKTQLMRYDLTKKEMKRVNVWDEKGENADISFNGNIAYTKDYQLFVADVKNQGATRLTSDGTKDIVYGKSVHRDEFGISKGTFWSPNGNKLAFYRMDQSMVTDYSISDYRTLPAGTRIIKYPMAGGKSHHVKIVVYNLESGNLTTLDTGEPEDQYLTNITWAADNNSIYVQVLNRDQNELKLNEYNLQSGKLVRTLLTETHEKYVEPLHELTFLPNNPYRFIYQSQRDGFNHLYIYDTNGKEQQQLTKGDWMVTEILGFDAKRENVFINSTKESPLEIHAYRVNIATGDMTLLNPEKGVHSIKLCKTSNYALDNYSEMATPLVQQLVDLTKGKTVETLNKVNNLLKDYNTGEKSFLTLKSLDGTTDLYARIIKPADFDAKKKYPVMYYVYGGPHVQLVQNRWLGGADMFMEYMASQGYVVFTLDNRGSEHRGREFEQATFRQLGTVEMDDQRAGINYLKGLSFVDTTRMGCFGWSFGGFMTTSMMMRTPGTFKAGVAGGPVIDWKFYEIMYTERYMDTPEANPEGYKKASLLNYVENLNGKLLIVQGLEDDTVLPQHSATLVNECIAKGVLLDYFPYPNHPHNVRGKDRVHLYKKVEDYFKRNL